MLVKEFQHESKKATPSPDLTPSQPRLRISDEGEKATIESMLMALRLQHLLTENDKDFLDQLAPSNSIAFLIEGTKYHHPEDVNLFPVDLISPAVNQSREAFFSHRCETESPYPAGYKIHTAVINPDETDPIVLGFFGPEQVLNRASVENRFYDFILRCRQIYRSQTRLYKKLKNIMADEKAVIIVNRTSGRILAINEAAGKLFNPDQASLTGKEYGVLKKQLPKIITYGKLGITNISNSNLHLSIVTIEVRRQNKINKNYYDYFFASARNKVAAIRGATNNLKKASEVYFDSEVNNYLNDIQTELTELDQYLSKSRILYNYSDRHESTTEISEILNRLIPRLNTAKNTWLQNFGITDKITIGAPKEVITSLLEVILRVHRGFELIPRATIISTDSKNRNETVRLRIETELDDTPYSSPKNKIWKLYAEEMIKRIGLETTALFHTEENKLITEIFIEMVK